MPFKVYFLQCSQHSSVQWTAECVAQSDIFCFSTLLLTTFCVLKSERLSSLVSVSVSVRCQTAQSSGQACLQNVSTQAWDLRNIYINGHLLLNKFSFVWQLHSVVDLRSNLNVKYKFSDEWYVFNLYFQIKAINNEIKKYFVISFRLRWWNQCSIEVG